MTTPRSIIWGSGVVYPNQKLSAIPLKVLAVRGPLTRKYLLSQGVNCPEVYGDPALLFPKYYKPKVHKKYKLGIIPHFRDKGNSIVNKLKFDSSVLLIDVQNIHPWQKFIDDINMCEHIASSSLHGIIISDAYNVPNVWIEFEGGESKQFAFHDYFQSVEKDVKEPLIVTQETTLSEIIGKCLSQKIKIDLDKLASICPFN
jgi:pyruvyltransferase